MTKLKFNAFVPSLVSSHGFFLSLLYFLGASLCSYVLHLIEKHPHQQKQENILKPIPLKQCPEISLKLTFNPEKPEIIINLPIAITVGKSDLLK